MCPEDEPGKLNKADGNPEIEAGVPSDRSIQRFEAELAGLSPRAVRLDRERLMFLAGQASASGPAVPGHRGWAWPTAFSAMSALAAGLLLTLVLRQPREVVKIVQVPADDVRSVGQARADRQNDVLSPSNEGVVAQNRPSRPEVIAEVTADRTAQGRPYVELRDRVLAMGFDGWPSDTGRPSEMGGGEGARSPSTYHDLLDSLLHGG